MRKRRNIATKTGGHETTRKVKAIEATRRIIIRRNMECQDRRGTSGKDQQNRKVRGIINNSSVTPLEKHKVQ